MNQEPLPLESRVQAGNGSCRFPFQKLGGPEWERLLSAAALVTCLLYVGWIVAVGVSQGMGNDFLHYWNSNRTWILGGNPYERLLPVAGDVQETTVFPLWMLWPFWPLGFLPYELAVRVFFVLNVLFLGCTLYVLKRLLLPALSGWRWHLILLLAVWLSVPALYSAQSSVLVVLFLALCLAKLEAQHPFIGGALLGLTLIKPHTLFANWFLLPLGTWLHGQRRLSFGLASSAVLIVGLSAALLPGWWQVYLTGDFTWIVMPDQRGGAALWPKATLLEWAPLVLGWKGWSVYALYGGLGLALAVLSVYCIRAYLQGRLPLPHLTAVGVITSLLLIPYAREYDYSLLILPALSAVALARQLGRASSRLAALGLLAIVGIHLRGGPMSWAYFTPLILGALLATLVVRATREGGNAAEANAP